MQKLVFLLQSDTTVGIVSQNVKKLQKVKQRDDKKPFLKTISSFKELKEEVRVPLKYKKLVRRAKKTTFIYSNKKAIRVAQDIFYKNFLKRWGWMYSTSANKSGSSFDFGYIKDRVDIIVFNKEKFEEKKASKLYQLGSKKMRRVR